jgi:hypothetical protein
VLLSEIRSPLASPEGNDGGDMSTQGFDASQVKRSTWIAGGGAVVLLLSTFFAWWTVSAGGFSASASGWDTGALGKLVFLVALIAIILVVVDHMKIDISQLPVAPSLALLGDAAIGVLFVLWRFLDTPNHVSWAWGLYVALLASLALTYGAWLKLQEA